MATYKFSTETHRFQVMVDGGKVEQADRALARDSVSTPT